MAVSEATLDRFEELLDSIATVMCCPTHDADIQELLTYRDKIVDLWSVDMGRQHDDGTA